MSNPWVICLKLIGVPIGLLVIVGIAATELPDHQGSFEYTFFLLSLLVNQAALLVVAVRLKLSLLTRRYHLPIKQAVRIHFQSMYYFFVLPMTVGIELSRIAKLIVLQPSFSKVSISLATFFDRLVGVFAPLTITVLLGPRYFDYDIVSTSNWIPASLVAVVISLIAVTFFRNRIIAFLKGFDPLQAAYALVLSLPAHLLFCLASWLGIRALGFEIDLSTAVFVISASTMLMMVPLSLGGAGAAEATGVIIWMWLGFELETALILTAVPFVLRLLAAIQGACWEVYDGIIGISHNSNSA